MAGIYLNRESHDLRDRENRPLREGDRVQCHSYGLGTCDVVTTEGGLAYRSIESGEQRTWSDLVDAETKRQHVSRLDRDGDAEDKS